MHSQGPALRQFDPSPGMPTNHLYGEEDNIPDSYTINRLLVIASQPYAAVTFHNKSGPLRKLYGRYDTYLDPLQLLFNLLPDSNRAPHSLKKSGVAVLFTWISTRVLFMRPSSSLNSSLCLSNIPCKALDWDIFLKASSHFGCSPNCFSVKQFTYSGDRENEKKFGIDLKFT